ncbi:MAG: membrane fusion protein of tripartite multidrug resistance system [Methylomonas sp.]|nr:MAG: membrane fusion protein of tripartite multidrug resistance system [Methylomonas sp.]
MLHPIRRRDMLRRRNRRLTLLTLCLLLATLAALGYWWIYHRNWISTDDAFVAGHLVTIKAQTDGTVVDVLTENTLPVKKGDVLLRLDGHHANIALAQAEAELAEAVRGIVTLKAKVESLNQRIVSREASLTLVRHDLQRYLQAAKPSAASAQQVAKAQDKMVELQAGIREILAEQASVVAQLQDSSIQSHPSVAHAKSRLRKAFLDYQRRNVIAPVAGIVAKRKVHIGDYLKAGAPLLVIVPLDEVWVEANFLETQIAGVRPGQEAEIRVDADGDNRLYHGRVQGINPATGSSFALLPTDNSTGNFIHIAERLQVRIALDAAELKNHPLRPGLSTLTRIKLSQAGNDNFSSTVNVQSPAYRTDIYANELNAAEDVISSIIVANSQ